MIYNKEGLSAKEANEHLLRDGYNEIVEKKTHPFLKFLSYFWGPIPWMIETAVIVSAIAGAWNDFGIILVLLIANASIGFFEEHEAANAIEALKAQLPILVKVKREGKWITLKSREIVIGDLVRLRIGDIVPADAIIIEGEYAEVDQSALTGESLPVVRKVDDLLFAGSILKKGEVDAVVKATGIKTYFGKTVQLVESAKTISHLQQALLRMGNYLIGVAIVLVILILTVSLYRNEDFLTILKFVLVLIVASIPTALPTVLSVNLAIGAKTLAKKEAIVSRLSSIEELAGVDILCCDKTGTLTQNKISIATIFSLEQDKIEYVQLYAALASRLEDLDPIDNAIINSYKDQAEISSYNIKEFHPFDPVSKRTEATVTSKDGTIFKVSKGSVPNVLKLCQPSDEIRKQIDNYVNDFASRGFRSLGVARTIDNGSWQFLGVIALYDPPREDSKNIIHEVREMGVGIKMMTGDQLPIAKEIGRRLDIGENMISASFLFEKDKKPSSKISETIEKVDGIAEVYPEHKYLIVSDLQQTGHIVGMTGDGVNDAPALKKADTGIAVANATDAARAAAAIILLSPGLSVISEAIKESRRIFQRMKSYAIYRIAETIRILLLMSSSILLLNFYPLTAAMIVILALLNDGTIISIAFDRAEYEKKPEVWDIRKLITLATILGVTGLISSFLLFYYAAAYCRYDHDFIQSLFYLKLSIAGAFLIFVTRTRGPFFLSRPSIILFSAVVGAQSIATLVVVNGIFMTPISWKWAGIIWAYAITWVFITDCVKLAYFKIQKMRGIGI